MKNNAIFIILLLFLAVTSFFWFQTMRITDLPPDKQISRPAITGQEAEEFIKLAEGLLINYREPLPDFYGRDPFYKEPPVEVIEVAMADPVEKFTLSSIIYSDIHALAVVNGEILAEGDTIYDEESGSVFMIEAIEVDRVEIMNGNGKYTLKKAPEDGRNGRNR